MDSEKDSAVAVQPAGEGDWIVQRGDSMASIAAATGHFADTLWNLSGNASLKKARQDGEILLPGDKVTVTPIQPKRVAIATGARTLATACPFCLNMMTDGMAGTPGGENVKVLDIAELLLSRRMRTSR